MRKINILKEKALNKGYLALHKVMTKKRDGFNELIIVCGLAIIAVVVLIAAKTPINELIQGIITSLKAKINDTLFAGF